MSFLTINEALDQISKEDFISKDPDKFSIIVLGRITNLTYHNYKDLIIKNMNIYDPENEKLMCDFVSKHINQAILEDKTLIFIIACHGSNNKEDYKLMFNEHGKDENGNSKRFVISANKLTYATKIVKQKYPNFKCIGLIQACYSNYFDISCFDASITLGKGISRWDLITRAVLDSLKSNKNKFTLGDIYKNLTQQLKLASCWSIAEEESPDLKNCKINGNCKFIKSY